jgi:hypothetical protein
MMKAKKVLTSTLAAVMAATAITAVVAPASATTCKEWGTPTVYDSYCDYNSGPCEHPWDARHSFFVVKKYTRECTENGKTITQNKFETLKSGCC